MYGRHRPSPRDANPPLSGVYGARGFPFLDSVSCVSNKGDGGTASDHPIRCSPLIHRTVPLDARITTLSVVRIISPVGLLRRFTP